jgi:hypothetical protein
MLEYVAASFRVVRHVRPKLSCARCERIVQSEALSWPIARDLAGPGLLAPVLVAKYADHLPLYRQSAIDAREGVELERSTLADWIDGASALLQPLVRGAGQGDAEGRQAAYRRHACPGTGAGPWHDQDRPAMDAHDDRPAAWRSTTALPSGRYGVWRSGRKNWLFAGSDAGRQRAAAIYSLVETCTLNAVNPKPTCATCSASSQIIPSIASPSSYLGTLVTSLPGSKNSGPPADAYGSTGAQVVSTP